MVVELASNTTSLGWKLTSLVMPNEKYLSTVLVEASKPNQPGLFESPLREIEAVSKRKAAGVFYTPPEICRFLVEKALDEYGETRTTSSRWSLI